MLENKENFWLERDDKEVVTEMLLDPATPYWDECYKFVKKLVQMQAKDVPLDYQEDIVQNALIRVATYLDKFRYECRLSTWLATIARNSIIDFQRKYIRESQKSTTYEGSEDSEFASKVSNIQSNLNVEEEYIIREDLKSVIQLIGKYDSAYPNGERNREILRMVLLEGQSLQQVAQRVGCSIDTVSYVVRAGQRYVRERLSSPLHVGAEKKGQTASRHNFAVGDSLMRTAPFGSILRHERQMRGWTQQDLTTKILELCDKEGGYSALDIKTVGRWERGENKLSPYYRKVLSQLFSRNAIELGFIE